MGNNNLSTVTANVDEIEAADINQFVSALNEDLVPRNTSGVPTDSGGDLGDGVTDWNNIRFSGQLIQGGSVRDLSSIAAESHQIQSGLAATSGYPTFLTPVSSTTNGKIDAATTSLVAVINNATVTISSDQTITGMTTAPASNNTCLVNDTALAGEAETKYLGEDGQALTIDNIGSEISSLDGTVQCFKKGSEYFLAHIDSTNNRLFPFMRGVARTDREALSNNDTLTLMKANYVFVEDDGLTTHKTVLHPTFEDSDPASATSNQWYFNGNTKRWRRYSGSWSNMDAHWLGFFILDDTETVAAHSNNFDVRWKSDLQGKISTVDTETVRVQLRSISVYGVDFSIQDYGQVINITEPGDLESGVSEATDTVFYIYCDKLLKLRFSDKAPRMGDSRLGMYHPSEYWRCVGWVYNDGEGDLAHVKTFTLDEGDHRINPDYIPHFGTAAPVYIDGTSFSVAKVGVIDSTGKVFIRQPDSITVDVSTFGATGMLQSANLDGTVSSSATAVTGVGTSFLTDFLAGQVIYAGGEGRVVQSITNDLALTLVSAPYTPWSGATYKRGGEAPDIELHLYAISDKTGESASLALSNMNVAAGDTLLDLPAGYTKYAQLPFSLINDTDQDIYPFKVVGWSRFRGEIHYNIHFSGYNTTVGETNVLDAGTDAIFTDIDLSAFIPETSREAKLKANANSSSAGTVHFRENGDSSDGLAWSNTNTGSVSNLYEFIFFLPTDSSQIIEYKRTAGAAVDVSVLGYVVDQVT